IPYNPHLVLRARELRNNSTTAEIILWLQLKKKQMRGYDFHRQKPIDNYILDFFCHELMLGIEIDQCTHELMAVYNRDIKKEKTLKALGITILRLTEHQVLKDIINVLNT